MDLGTSEVMESEVLYDCVICGQSGPSTEDRPTGLVVLLQASSGTSPLPGSSQMSRLIPLHRIYLFKHSFNNQISPIYSSSQSLFHL